MTCRPPLGRGLGAAEWGCVMRRVVITGVGVVAPNGVGKDAFWKACVDGHSGIGPIRSFDASNHPIRVAGEVHDFDPTPFIPDKFRKVRQGHGPGRQVRHRRRRAGRHATAASTSSPRDPERSASSWAPASCRWTSANSPRSWPAPCQEDGEFDETRSPTPAGDSAALPALAAEVPAEHGGGPHLDGVQLPGAEQHGRDRVRRRHPGGRRGVPPVVRGDADVMLAGGADSRIDPLMLLAYTALGTLSRGATGRRRSGRGRSTACATASCISEGAGGAGARRVRAGQGPQRARSTPR